jgi:phage terminase large subunit-like protein
VAAYARSVVAGKVPAGQLQILACERHLDDLKTGKKRGLKFDAEEAGKAITFFTYLKHSKGQWAGQGFELSPWQAFIVGSLFGWKREDGKRRFRTAYNEVPRKNGKSTLSAGIALRLAFFDGEHGADVFCAATKREQAKIVFDEAARMREKSPALKKRIGAFVGNLHIKETASKLQPLGADADSMDGLNIHGAVVDELHAHKTRAMVDVLETSTGARAQPLVFYITTAGTDRNSVCWSSHEYGVKVLDGIVQDDTLFVFIACADEGDSWEDPKTWAKANPNLGVSVHLDDLERKAARAREIPSEQNAFRRLHCNEWTESISVWIPDDVWMRGDKPVDELALRGRPCFAGLDLAQTRDITAFVLLFPDDEGAYDVVCRFWCPRDQIAERSRRDRAPYDVWAAQGLLIATEGDVTDYDFVEREVLDLAEEFDLRQLAFDRYMALQIVTHLKDHLGQERVIDFGQGFVSMAAPTRELERLAVEGKLRHGGNPVLRWMNKNVAIRQDAAGNMKIDKAKSAEKVDGVVAMTMALAMAIRQAAVTVSVYEQPGRGLLVL